MFCLLEIIKFYELYKNDYNETSLLAQSYNSDISKLYQCLVKRALSSGISIDDSDIKTIQSAYRMKINSSDVTSCDARATVTNYCTASTTAYNSNVSLQELSDAFNSLYQKVKNLEVDPEK